MADNIVDKKPKVKLIGTDGNVFALAGKVKAALLRIHRPDLAKEFVEQLVKQPFYSDALSLMMKYVDVR